MGTRRHTSVQFYGRGEIAPIISCVGLFAIRLEGLWYFAIPSSHRGGSLVQLRITSATFRFLLVFDVSRIDLEV